MDPKNDYLWFYPAICTLCIGAIAVVTTHSVVRWFGLLSVAAVWFFSTWLATRRR